MKAVILAGGFGTRISEETVTKPKPMIEIGGMPILWHIMKMYSYHDINDFIICLGYKGSMIKDFFARYYLYNSNVTFDLADNTMEVHRNTSEPWRVTVVDTGETTLTGGRLKRIASYLDDEDFCMTYGDGVGDVNITDLIRFHREQGRLATLTATSPPGRFGAIEIQKGKVTSFKEKPNEKQKWINGGFFVLSPRVMDYIANDETSWEAEPLEQLSSEGELAAYQHNGFWQPMDTLANKRFLEELWNEGRAPWKVWEHSERLLVR